MFCPSCGQQNRSDDRFCDKCGARLSQGGQAVNMPPPQSQFGTQGTGPGGLGWQSPTTVNQPLPISVPQRSASMSSATPVNPSVQSGGKGGIVGMARNIQIRSEQSAGGQQGGGPYGRTVQILTFRLELYDQSGNRTQVKSVEMRGLSVIGFISDGDQVEVFGKSEDGLVRAKQVHNLTTSATVKVKGRGRLIIPLTILAIFLVTIATFVFIVVQHPGLKSYLDPNEVPNNFCKDINGGVYQAAYDQYSMKLKSEVSLAQLTQMWSDKDQDYCSSDNVIVSGNQANVTLHSSHYPFYTTQKNYNVTLIKEGLDGWKIDSIQRQ